MPLVIKAALLGLSVTLGTAMVAEARQSTPRIDHRQHHQVARIFDGDRDGDLTRGEAHRLLQGQRHVNRIERRALSDGIVTGRERVRIEMVRDRQSQRIYRARNNGRERP